MKAQQLSGAYGDIFWALQSVTDYVAYSTLAVLIYVANTTDNDLTYSIQMTVTNSAGTVLAQGPLIINERTYFTVGAHEFIMLPGEIISSFSDAMLRLDLIEQQSNRSTDSTSTYLSKPSVAGLPVFGGPSTGTSTSTTSSLDSVMNMLMMVMMLGMMMNMMKGFTKSTRGSVATKSTKTLKASKKTK